MKDKKRKAKLEMRKVSNSNHLSGQPAIRLGFQTVARLG